VSVGRVFGDGTIRLDDAYLSLPTPLAWRTVAGGGGVCFREPDGKRVYPASTYWSPAVACAAWMSDIVRTTQVSQRHLTAHDRYRFVLERKRQTRDKGVER